MVITYMCECFCNQEEVKVYILRALIDHSYRWLVSESVTQIHYTRIVYTYTYMYIYVLIYRCIYECKICDIAILVVGYIIALYVVNAFEQNSFLDGNHTHTYYISVWTILVIVYYFISSCHHCHYNQISSQSNSSQSNIPQANLFSFSIFKYPL